MAGKSIFNAFNIVFLALLSFVLYRKDALILFYKNHPSRMPQINALDRFDIRFQDVVRNCEDALLNESEGWVLLSCDPGRDRWNTVMGTWTDPTAPPETGLYLYRYADSPDSPPTKLELPGFNPDPKDFHPLGVEYHEPSRTLFVVNHAFSGSRIELFKLHPSPSNTATHLSTIIHPLLHTPNSIAVASESEFFVTNDHHFPRRTHPILSVLETYLTFPKGNVAHVLLPSPSLPTVQVRILASIPFANGLALMNPSTLAVASSSTATVTLFSILRDPTSPSPSSSPPSLSVKKVLKLPFLPDNLSVDGSGALLIAGHPHAPTIGRVAEGNWRCYREGRALELVDPAGDGCERAPSWIAEWTEEGGRRDLYAGSGFGSAVTAVRDGKRGVGVAVGLYERGVLVWKA